MRRPSLPLGIYRVAGDSMVPTYRPGATLLGLRWFRPRPGQVVVAARQGRLIIKRLAKREGGQAWLRGDNPAHSTDSRHFGPLADNALQARIIAKLG